MSDPSAHTATQPVPAENPMDQLWRDAQRRIRQTGAAFAVLMLMSVSMMSRASMGVAKWYHLAVLPPAYFTVTWGFNAYAGVKHYFAVRQMPSSS